MEEECFFSCEPRLIKWQVVNDTIKGVPICGDYCDDWYEACKDDETCTHDWFAGFNYTNDMYTCPINSECQTFKQVCNIFGGKNTLVQCFQLNIKFILFGDGFVDLRWLDIVMLTNKDGMRQI